MDFPAEELTDGLLNSIKSGFIKIYKQKVQPSTTTNSAVLSIPAIDGVERFLPDHCNVAASFVAISGPTDEPLHYHSSHLVGLVISGEAYCRYLQPASSRERRDFVVTGDIVVLPRGAMHIFECDPGKAMSYVALEFSDKEIDYQKHFTDIHEAHALVSHG